MHVLLLFLHLLILNVFIVCLKLTLKQDLMELPRHLSPREIGQFLHSITDLPRLAELLDPERNSSKVDFSIYYNTHGCADTRVFNWNRILSIMNYPRLSREDRLVLLNGVCITQWPDLLKIPLHDLTFLLNLFPEINPLKHFLSTGGLVSQMHWQKIVQNHPNRWKIFLANAQANGNLNFVPFVDMLIENRFINLTEHFNATHYSLIGPNFIETCYASAKKPKHHRKCSKLFVEVMKHSRSFSPRDTFYWTLNLGTMLNYELPEQLPSLFTSLRESCSNNNDPLLANFVESFSKIFAIWVVAAELDNSAITGIFETLLKSPPPQEFTGSSSMDVENDDSDSTLHPPSIILLSQQQLIDPLFMAIEFYAWLRENDIYFGIHQDTLECASQAIQRRLARYNSYNKPASDVVDYYLNFFLNHIPHDSVHVPSFKAFIYGNYDPERPSHSLLKALRLVSWTDGPKHFKMMQIMKRFLSHESRLLHLRRSCFEHPDDSDMPAFVEIYFGEETHMDVSLFMGVFESVMRNNILVFPLNLNISTSSLLRGLLGKGAFNLESVLQKFWLILGTSMNYFMCAVDIDPEDDDHFDLNYPQEQVPYPWTHPNIMMAMGCVMTLAVLHGFKLKTWRLKRSLFRSLFRINLSSPLYEDGNEILDSGYFMSLYEVNHYMKPIENQQADKDISDSIDDLMKIDGNVPIKLVQSYQMSLLAKEEDFYRFHVDDDKSVFASKVFGMLADLDDSVQLENMTSEEIFQSIPLQDMHKSALDPEFISGTIDLMTSNTEINSEISREMAKIQIYALYLGMQPLTRFLNAKEAYDAIFLSKD